jgi:hypothetical protein
MKVVIFGSRSITDFSQVLRAVEASGVKDKITEIVSGTARGVDTLGEDYARLHSIPVKRYPPDWRRWGSMAGPIRNKDMADYADYGIAVWDGKSGGTKDMIRNMTGRVYIHIV